MQGLHLSNSSMLRLLLVLKQTKPQGTCIYEFQTPLGVVMWGLKVRGKKWTNDLGMLS